MVFGYLLVMLRVYILQIVFLKGMEHRQQFDYQIPRAVKKFITILFMAGVVHRGLF